MARAARAELPHGAPHDELDKGAAHRRRRQPARAALPIATLAERAHPADPHRQANPGPVLLKRAGDGAAHLLVALGDAQLSDATLDALLSEVASLLKEVCATVPSDRQTVDSLLQRAYQLEIKEKHIDAVGRESGSGAF